MKISTTQFLNQQVKFLKKEINSKNYYAIGADGIETTNDSTLCISRKSVKVPNIANAFYPS